ncbi:type IX secretion system sortase PorU [Xanthovirga aplysinae]|uniref:type IX secretion system sortase PorU n=1 Tax=Xanthovirga aplysinae TaxID=2529853 RepID=UPI0012BBC196|nr:type IX secretion system sortase PorU [Xanthovirga aplysinae]MTI32594.1 type IX secretion system sortase PorU [Xanthovirga aplysinae]
MPSYDSRDFPPFVLALLVLFVYLTFSFSAKAQVVKSSVLANGDWYKIAVTENGIYQIDYEFLKSMGINVDKVDPKKISLWGNGGKMLPQRNDVERPQDLLQNAIFLEGEENGKFDNQDYLLFFGQGPDTYTFDPEENQFSFQKNIYSDTTFYFLHIGNENGLRIQKQENAGNDFPTITSYDDYISDKKENINFLRSLSGGAGSGRKWYSEDFSNDPNKIFNFNVSGILSNSNLQLFVSLAARAYDTPAAIELSLNGYNMEDIEVPVLSSYRYASKATQLKKSFNIETNQININENQLDLNIKLNSKGASNTAVYLDYLFFQFKRKIQLYVDQTIFRSLQQNQNLTSTFLIDNVNANSMIWDISDPAIPKLQEFTLNESQGKFGTSTEGFKEFIAFNPQNYKVPLFIKKISNQNLHAQSPPDLLIVVHPQFWSEAKRLANYRRSHQGLKVLIVTPDQVYNEFSSGSQDITAIRDFVKFLYEQAPDTDGLKYLLLFGDASYDFKNRIAEYSNFVPTYESRESLHPVNSYASDDYYGFLEAHEGEWVEENLGPEETLDIGIGRFPINTLEEAKLMVDKVIGYSSNENSLGKWRNDIYFVADDDVEHGNNMFQEDTEFLTNIIDTNYPQLNVHKLYLDAFPQVSGPSGRTSPELNTALNQAIEKGAFMVNYIGHGSETLWSDERILTISMIMEWENMIRLPIFVTATCEFGRYDDPDPARKSGAEFLLMNPKGGAVATVTTTRPVEAFSNFQLSTAFYSALGEAFNQGNMLLGDVFRKAKNNNRNDISKRSFALLGDPSLPLAIPFNQIKLKTINNFPIEEADTLKALKQVSIKGEINDQKGNKLTDFQGILDASVFDKKTTLSTFGFGDNPVMYYQEHKNALFRGQASIQNGEFEFQFIVPKNIDYQLGNGKINLYASPIEGINDAGGANTSILVGGSTDSPADNTPPEMSIFMNDSSFVEGAITGPNSLLVVKLSDESGINISSAAIGQDITATLDGTQTFILNDYYQSDIDTYKEGWVRYPLNGLEEGHHEINVKARDIHGNSTEGNIEFIVVKEGELLIKNLYNFPNPFSKETKFTFEHNMAGKDLNVKIEIFGMNGTKVTSIEQTIFQSPANVKEISWNGHRQSGGKVNRGIYIYKISVTNLENNIKNHAFGKLVLIN